MKIGSQSLTFSNVYLKSSAVTSGPLEAQGPLGKHIDRVFDDNYCEEKSWEKAEINLLKTAVNKCLDKSLLKEGDIDYVISGDLINQNGISNYTFRDYKIPFFGVYGACSTSVEGLILSSIIVESKAGNNVLTSTSSHNSTAEKQYRYPTEYGGKKPGSMTFTVTGAGASVITNEKTKIKITKATVGRVIDAGLNNPMDMGSAMAPSAVDTFLQHLNDFNVDHKDYDLIVTGDLSAVGSSIFEEAVESEGIKLDNYNDCGLMIYDIAKQPVFSGGSGAGCSAVVMYSYIVDQLLKGDLNKVLVIATGALLSPIIMQQKETIPCISQAIVLERCNL